MTHTGKQGGKETGDVATLDAARWVEAHGDALFGFALARLHVRAEAEDAVQETFLAALGARSRYRGESGERAWLFGILKHKVVDRLRSRTRAVALESDEQADAFIAENFSRSGRWQIVPQGWSRPDEDAEKGEFWEVLTDCLGGLPDSLGTTFRLLELDGLGTEEACKVLGISATNAWVRLHRARFRLRECLERHWFGKSGQKRRKDT
ncbi:MAG: sigma-70 family RNA polymerase sigma factor [Gammaproteobacteria bacterium]